MPLLRRFPRQLAAVRRQVDGRSVLRRRPGDEDEEWRASSAELFFDLVFVLVVTQLSALLLDDLTISGATKTLFLLLVGWWAWIYTTWATNWFDPDRGPVRALVVLLMLASMLGAAAIPDAFGERALLLVVGYVSIQSLRNAFMVLATDRSDPLHLPLVRILAWNLWVGAIWFAGAMVDHDARLVVWTVALLCDYAGPLAGHWTPGLGRSDPREWELEPGHFAERLMLFLMIALGETIVASGLTASQLEITPARLAALVVAFGVALLLWWLYFDFHAERMLGHLKSAADRRGRLARELSYLLVPMVAGIIVCAVASELVLTHPGDEPGRAELLTLGAGPALYLGGSVIYKMRVFGGLWHIRAIAVALVAGATALGSALPALATWTLMFAILAGVAVAERVRVGRSREPADVRV